MHCLLEQQAKRFLHRDTSLPPGWDMFLAAVDDANRRMICERVEAMERLDYPRKTECDEMPGHLFSRPDPAAEMTRLLQSGESIDLSMEA